MLKSQKKIRRNHSKTNSLDKFYKSLTFEISIGYFIEDYKNYVLNWISIFDSKNEFKFVCDSGVDKIIKTCYENKIATLSCARYISDKMIFKDSPLKENLKIMDIDSLITSKTIFKEIIGSDTFILSAKIGIV